MKKDIIIFDLDGTLALIEHRRKYITGKRKNWHRFFEECEFDLPNNPVIKMNNLLFGAGFKIFILSGRSRQVEQKTIDWLKKYEVKYHMLLMREEKDNTPDEILKKNWLEEIDKDKILCVFDDRDKVVNMWRNNNITCFQVAKGDF